jgi:hypothetical protein
MSLRLLTAFSNYLTALNTQVTPLVMESATIAATTSRDYDLTTLFPDHAEYDMLSCKVEVLVKDTEAASPLLNYYTNGEAFITTGITTGGLVRIHNFHTDPVDVSIRITAPSKKLP